MPARAGRPKEPEGKRHTICTKLSDSELEAIEAARGSTDRSEWVRLALLAAAERQQPFPGSADRQAGAVRENLAALKGDCPHPSARINKGLCGACGTYVGKREGQS